MLNEGVDFIQIFEESIGGRPSQDYAINIQSAKEIAMLNGGEKGKEARLYFIECERKSKEVALHSFQIEDPIKRAERWIEEHKQKALLVQKVDNLKTVLDEQSQWGSIIKIAKHNKVKETVFNWRVLMAKSNELGYTPKTVPCPRFGTKKLYHVNVFRACYPQYNYDMAKE
jgi:hypothetical protein